MVRKIKKTGKQVNKLFQYQMEIVQETSGHTAILLRVDATT